MKRSCRVVIESRRVGWSGTEIRTDGVRDCGLKVAVAIFGFMMNLSVVAAQEETVPHNQSKPPGPALSPEECIQRMTVPDGFSVELVAAEPDLVNPVAMTFDEQGRIWVTESLEYPRRSPGPGRDRVRVLEDTDGDGRVDRATTFADGLNIPSGIAVGHGGVWVANAPDILFLEDTDGDLRADRSEVVVTGFGRQDTHELPNSLTWGPDGWLYGLNGVFNPCRVEQNGRVFEFTCALFRIHPRTHEFQLFAEGTSNPWGIAWNPTGDAFLSACVIDHLWHLTESGYYHRQGGPYPPFTWKIGSIVEHKHQKAAYCGIHYYDSDVYPPEWRECLFMGNIHGNCVNTDVLEDRGATYFATPRPDFLTVDDAWFMPVAQKTGPDGSLYVLDWYDRYHCYQDANRDPDGIDRLKGRLYRIRWKDTPRAAPLNLSQETSSRLIDRLDSGNGFIRRTALRILSERADQDAVQTLENRVRNADLSLRSRLLSLWSLIGGGTLTADFCMEATQLAEADLRAWAVRASGDLFAGHGGLADRIGQLADDPAARVRVQVAVAASKWPGPDDSAARTLMRVLAASPEDGLIPHIVWQNLYPQLPVTMSGVLDFLETLPSDQQRSVSPLLPRMADRLLAEPRPDVDVLARLLRYLMTNPGDAKVTAACLELLTDRRRSGELSAESAARPAAFLSAEWRDPQSVSAGEKARLERHIISFLAACGDADAVEEAVRMVRQTARPGAVRVDLLESVGITRSAEAVRLGRLLLAEESLDESVRVLVVQALGRIPDSEVGVLLLEKSEGASGTLRAAMVETLTDRIDWATGLLRALADGRFRPEEINANQARKILSHDEAELTELLNRHWGVLRTTRDPNRAAVMYDMRDLLLTQQGDPAAGQLIFRRVCGQCHRMYGEGAQVGPDITRNGRSSFEQLLSNVFDPSLVIGSAYQAVTVVTTDGRVVTGLPKEDNDRRIVLQVQGDKQEVIPRDQVEEQVVSRLSLMPEGLEKQITRRELVDLFSFLTLDRPPTDPTAGRIAGAELRVGETRDRSQFAGLLQQLLPEFSVDGSGERGVGVLKDHGGRPAVRTHPVSRTKPSILSRRLTVPPEGTTVILRAVVAADANGDWEFRVRVNGELLKARPVTPDPSGSVTWMTLDTDLTEYLGQTILLELENAASGWSWEYGYWNRIELINE